MNIRILCVGKLSDRFYTDAANEYIKRLSGYCTLEIIELREQRLPSTPSAAQIGLAFDKERAAIMEKIPDGAYTVALCIEGREMDSGRLAGLLSSCASRGVSRMCFVIGGSFGLSEDMKKAADVNLSLSQMTFPHSLARVMLLEQLYRAYKINEGGRYHK